MVEMHLLSVNVDFHYDPIYALGVVTAFERFMQGYHPERDQPSIFNALCQSLGTDPQKYQKDAQHLRELVVGLSAADLINWLNQSETLPGAEDVQSQIYSITANPKFKYSRLFAIGLCTLLEHINPDLVKDTLMLNDTLLQIGTALNIPADKLQKDLELYRSNLEKLAQAQSVLADILHADRKQREQRERTQETVMNPSDNAPPS